MLNHDRASRFIERARRGDIILGLHISSVSPNVVELAGMAGIDFCVIGMESESVSPHQLEELLRAGEGSGLVTMVKIRRPNPDLVEDAFTAGTQFVTAPHIVSAEQLGQMIEASRFANHGGGRGVCAVARYVGYGTKSIASVVAAANAYSPVIPIIEDKEALDNLDEILELCKGGIIEIGPFDLSLSLNCERPMGYGNEEVMEAIDVIGAKAKEMNISIISPVRYLGGMTRKEQIAHMHSELVTRGINMLYDGDLFLLKRELGYMAALRERE